MVKRIYLFLIVSFLFSCSNKPDLLTDKYWVKYKRNQPNLIVKFTKDGKFINYNKLEKDFKYTLVQNRLVITDAKGEKRKYFIKSLSDNELKLSEIIEVGEPEIDYYRKADVPDFFLGKWTSTDDKTFYIYDFSGDMFVEIDETIENVTQQKKLKYTIKNDTIIQIGFEKYLFSFEDDIKKLILKSPSGKILVLNRK